MYVGRAAAKVSDRFEQHVTAALENVNGNRAGKEDSPIARRVIAALREQIEQAKRQGSQPGQTPQRPYPSSCATVFIGRNSRCGFACRAMKPKWR